MEQLIWGMHVVLRMFPQAQGNVHKYFNIIEAALTRYGVLDLKLHLVAYATIAAESAGFSPITERHSHWNTLTIPNELVSMGESRHYNLYQSGSGATKGLFEHEDLGNTAIGDGQRYIGRGFIQLTGKDNYATYSRVVHRDLMSHPELANTADMAAEILAAFVHDHRGKIEASLISGDLRGARKAVNGGLHGLHCFVRAYKIGLHMISTGDRRFVGNIA
jgi:putative chitinase